MNELLFALRSGFGFLTTIPVGISMEGIERLMKHIYIFPFIGAVLGIIFGGIGYLSSLVFHPVVTSLIIIFSIYYLTGFNHIDGLADFGDGIASHGTREEKIVAMKDTAIGTGGLIFCMVAVLGIFSAIFSIQESNAMLLPYALVIAETSAKQSMITVAAFGRRLHEGFGAMTVENTKLSDFIAGMIFSTAACYLFLGAPGIEALIVAQLGALLILNAANRHFGGVSGDVVGASNEVGRLIALIFIAGASWML